MSETEKAARQADHCITLRYAADGSIEATETGAVPERLTWEQVEPLFHWALAELDRQPIDVPTIAA
jgi:hypothetical protein